MRGVVSPAGLPSKPIIQKNEATEKIPFRDVDIRYTISYNVIKQAINQ